jgi:hypothetical protein
MEGYSISMEEEIIVFYNSLREIDKRRYAGLEAKKLGRGGKAYICRLLKCDYKTINKGIGEIELGNLKDNGRSRISGGGRKLKVKDKQINEVFLEVINLHTAGTPTEDGVKWTYLNQEEIAEKMRAKEVKVSRFVVKQLLNKFSFVKRKSQKKSLRSA